MNQKICVVTGASSGIGFELTKYLVSKGHHVLAVARSRDKLERLNQDCANSKGQLQILELDITGPLDLIEEHVSRHGRIDIIVNNAGYLVNKPFETIENKDLELSYSTNVFAPFRIIQMSMSYLKAAEHPHVLNISSIGGIGGSLKFPGLTAYSSSKGALNILNECLAEEFKDTNIRFNVLALGAVQTEMLEKAFPGYVAPISSKEMATYIGEFAERHGQYFNGKTLPVSSTNP